MRFWRAAIVVTAAELAAVAAVGAVGGLGGRWNDWLDALNVLAPLWLLAALAPTAAAWRFAPGGRARTGVLMLGAVGAAASLVAVAPELARALPFGGARAEAAGAPLRVATLNAWKDNVDPEGTLAALLAADVDVVAVQERHGPFGRVREALAEAYPVTTQCRGRASALAVMSRRPLLASGCVGEDGPRTGPEDVEIAWLRVVAPDGRPATVATTHIGWPVPAGRQPRQSAAVAAHLAAIGPAGLILTGDFNTTPWTVAMRRQDARFAPLTRRTFALATWPARLPRVEAAFPLPILPIDHLYAEPAWRTRSVRRLARTGSDHYAVVGAFNR
jgi:endonuclease/exonuclease/phosphatase (EEP) superfamily protein YafD